MGNRMRKMAAMNKPPQRREIILERIDMPDFSNRGRIEIDLGPPGGLFQSKYAHREGETPLDAYSRGVGYSGPQMADKGQRDGSCNRTACQLPLKGQEQWTMPSYGRGGTDGLLYYCAMCAAKFHDADREMGQPFRCTLEITSMDSL